MISRAFGPDSFVLTLNAGSSSLKFALFEMSTPLVATATGIVNGIGQADARLRLKRKSSGIVTERPIQAGRLSDCLSAILDEVSAWVALEKIAAVGHRVVHGGPRYFAPEKATPELLAELRRLSPIDPAHLPAEIELIEILQIKFPALPQFACFDTGFHHDLPRVARLLPIPRRYETKGVRRYGFHGLSYQFLLEELQRLGDPAATGGRVILAHLGSGASLAAVLHGKCIDTSMGFTPTAGLVMATRTGDLDPGLGDYLARTEQMTAKQFNHLINHDSGLLGISEISADMRVLLEQEKTKSQAADAVEGFCYQAKKWIGGYVAALGGLDTLVFAGGIGENCPSIRERICRGLGYLNLELASGHNAKGAPVISTPGSRVIVRVIHTNEEVTMARAVVGLLHPAAASGNDLP